MSICALMMMNAMWVLQLKPELVGSGFDFLMEVVEAEQVDAGEEDL